jgi:acetate kinase
MNILSISQNIYKLEFAFFKNHSRTQVSEGEIRNWMQLDYLLIPDMISKSLKKGLIKKSDSSLLPDVITVRVPFGGTVFRTPALLSDGNIEKLKSIMDSAPLHIPHMIKLAETLRNFYGGSPVVLVFETSFFTDLPEREYSYAIDTGFIRGPGIRKFGYHGIYHRNAVSFSMKKYESCTKIMSVCMEPIPEICAIRNGVPVMSTSGTTPLEGLPGETTCGDLDPFIVLSLSECLGWGPEQINNMLTKESGMKGLTGRQNSLPDTFKSGTSRSVFAEEVFLYRCLLASGAGIAAMGGVDMIVFSGRYHSSGKIVRKYLTSKLKMLKDKVLWEYVDRSLLRLTADSGAAEYLRHTPENRKAQRNV